MKLSRAEYDALLRHDFPTYIARCFLHLFPNTPYLPNWHIDFIAMHLTDIMSGREQRLIINLPPRGLKSVIVSVALPAFILGHDPTREIVCVSYGQDLADKMAEDYRRIVRSDWYKKLFGPRLRDRSSLHDLRTPQGGGRLSTSVGGPLTGRGADLLIIDDPIKPGDALSDAARKSVNDWLGNTMASRLNDKLHGAIVLIMQRVHLDDPTGHLLERGGWKHLSLSAIAETDEHHVIRTMLETYEVHRRLGDALHPEREPLEVLNALLRDMGSYDFAGQYQQSPVPPGGGIVKREWFRTYEPTELPERFDNIIQSWDTASKQSELSDYSVCTTWGVRDKQRFLLHVLRMRMEYPELKRTVVSHAERFAATIILIEDRASGTQLVQELKQLHFARVEGVVPKVPKLERMHAQTAAIEDGQLLVPASAAWLDAYVHELTSFPFGRHDDQVDSTSQALAWMTSSLWGPGMGVLGYYRELAEAQRRGEEL